MTHTVTREQEILAKKLIADPDAFASAIIERRWTDLATALEFAQTDVSPELAATDPALYRKTRDSITLFYLRGGGSLSLENIRKLASTQATAQ